MVTWQLPRGGGVQEEEYDFDYEEEEEEEREQEVADQAAGEEPGAVPPRHALFPPRPLPSLPDPPLSAARLRLPLPRPLSLSICLSVYVRACVYVCACVCASRAAHMFSGAC